MTLDPIHVDNIARLASTIAGTVDATDREGLAERVWTEWLPELRRDGRVILEPVDEHARRRVDVDAVALAEPPFETVHGLDSGTINPTTFKNGLVIDVAHAAMAADPTDLDLHRSRTIVATVHTADTTVDHDTDWGRRDEGYTQQRVLQAPPINRYAEGVVHALALYLAESKHALDHANTVTDLLVLDGPIYPKELFTWVDRDPELGDLAREAKPRSVVENYVRLVETCIESGTPIAGFVKNPSGRAITRTLANAGVEAPWPDDAALFTRLLERRTDATDGTGSAPGAARRGERVTDELTATTWFRSRGGTDRHVAADGDALGVERRLDPELYEPTFLVIYDPRTDVTYKLEAPYAFTRDPDTRRALTTQVLAEVAAERGPPTAVAKADSLARIGTAETASIRRKFEEQFDTDRLRSYDDVRWPDVEG
ncbi:DNA double-strand break repair nuclease NurA [Halopenitus persicus]|uniref:DNA double-strand break repair nuclease NurA n=1 Tax=Halopenitus persicus TaxID=1048396 RepID=UPI000BBB4CFF|nr:DNA double-strand break repair nuclease NurA [Halopenitus persicus]